MSAIKLLKGFAASVREEIYGCPLDDESHNYCMSHKGWAALTDAIDTLLKTGGWMPIESAPKDGTEIIGYRRDAGAFLIRWDAPINFCTDKECEELGEETAEAEDWFCADFVAGSRLEGSETPTHWQPLPPLPESDHD